MINIDGHYVIQRLENNKKKNQNQNDNNNQPTTIIVFTARKYSIEYVFKSHSTANVIITLLRQFFPQKGTASQPKGFMWDRKDDLWMLLKTLYIEIELLLEREYKCQLVYSPCYIIGDIHGNIEDLMSMENSLWRQMPYMVSASYLFLGDYVDRGKWGFECVLYLIAFKLLCPNKVTLLRGNHEVRSIQRHYSYYQECLFKYGEVIGLKVWHLTNKIFDRLPVCAVLDDAIYCAHGGIPRSTSNIEQIRERVPRILFNPQNQSAIAWEILWSDPCTLRWFVDICEQKNIDPEAQSGYIFNVRRGTAFLFNETGAIDFLRSNALTHIIRAHEVAQNGYEFHFGTKCVTIFSSSHYCGNENDCGLILADNQRLRVIILDTVNNASATD